MTVAVFTAAGIIVPAPLNTSNHRLMSKGRAGRQQWLLLGRAAGPGGCWQGLQPREGIRAPLRQPLLQSGKPSLGLFKKGGVHCWVLKYTLDYLFYSVKQLLLGYSLTPWVTHPCLFLKRGIMFIHPSQDHCKGHWF